MPFKDAEARKEYHREYMRKKRGYTGKGPGAHNTPGEKHPQWKTGQRAFSQRMSPEYREKVRYCEFCNTDLIDAPSHNWCVHHIDHDRDNNTEDNFQLLCKRCHQIEHKCWENFQKGSTTIPKGSTPK